MISNIIKNAGFVVALIIAGSTNYSVAQQSESEKCRKAKGMYQLCYFSCIGSTAGGLGYAASVCGTKCSKEAAEMQSSCP